MGLEPETISENGTIYRSNEQWIQLIPQFNLSMRFNNIVQLKKQSSMLFTNHNTLAN